MVRDGAYAPPGMTGQQRNPGEQFIRNSSMALVLTEEQSMLRDSARGLISDKAPVSHLRQLARHQGRHGLLPRALEGVCRDGIFRPAGAGEFRRQRARLRRGRRGDGGNRPHPDAVAVSCRPPCSRHPRCRAAAARRRKRRICRRSPMARCSRRSRSTRAQNIARCRPICRRCVPATASGSTARRRLWSTATPPIS